MSTSRFQFFDQELYQFKKEVLDSKEYSTAKTSNALLKGDGSKTFLSNALCLPYENIMFLGEAPSECIVHKRNLMDSLNLSSKAEVRPDHLVTPRIETHHVNNFYAYRGAGFPFSEEELKEKEIVDTYDAHRQRYVDEFQTVWINTYEKHFLQAITLFYGINDIGNKVQIVLFAQKKKYENYETPMKGNSKAWYEFNSSEHYSDKEKRRIMIGAFLENNGRWYQLYSGIGFERVKTFNNSGLHPCLVEPQDHYEINYTKKGSRLTMNVDNALLDFLWDNVDYHEDKQEYYRDLEEQKLLQVLEEEEENKKREQRLSTLRGALARIIMTDGYLRQADEETREFMFDSLVQGEYTPGGLDISSLDEEGLFEEISNRVPEEMRESFIQQLTESLDADTIEKSG